MAFNPEGGRFRLRPKVSRSDLRRGERKTIKGMEKYRKSYGASSSRKKDRFDVITDWVDRVKKKRKIATSEGEVIKH